MKYRIEYKQPGRPCTVVDGMPALRAVLGQLDRTEVEDVRRLFVNGEDETAMDRETVTGAFRKESPWVWADRRPPKWVSSREYGVRDDCECR